MGDQSPDAVSEACPACAGRVFGDWVRLLRFPHWVKNAIVFPALLLAGRAGDAEAWRQAIWVFAAFCLASSAVYAVNDVMDQAADRAHPSKRERPVAAGRLRSPAVCWAALLLAVAGLAFASLAQAPAGVCVGLYLAVNAAYSLCLKHVPIVDACCVGVGFVLRVAAVTGWSDQGPRAGLLLASVFGLCFFLALAKRAVDLRALGAAGPNPLSVPAFDGYTTCTLRGLLWSSALLALVPYGLFVWTVAAKAPLAVVSLVPVAYSLLRMARLSAAGAYAEPVTLVRSDYRLVAAAAGWLALWVWVTLQ